MKQRNNDSFLVWGVGLAVLLLGAAAAVYYYQSDRATEAVEQVTAVPPPATNTTTPIPRPVPVAPPVQPAQRAVPLPPLDESDTEVRGGLTELFGRDAVTRFLVPERVVRNMVVTIDNLTREQMALPQRPIKPTPGEFVTSGPEEALVLAPENYGRYAPFIAVVTALDAKTLVSFYRGLQPLYQKAYEDLGNPNRLFNTRLLEVIDHLLATPTPPREIRLVQPSVFYRYADERLEKLSAGQKLLLRMGPENAAIVKAKLREIQAEML